MFPLPQRPQQQRLLEPALESPLKDKETPRKQAEHWTLWLYGQLLPDLQYSQQSRPSLKS